MAEEILIAKCMDTANRVRRSIIDMTYSLGSVGAHLGGSLSAVDLLVGLYGCALKYRVGDSNWEYRDRFILSKGHAALALYPVLAEYGIIDQNELESFKRDGSRLGGHPSLNGLPGIEFASGSLGQGLSLGVGTCLALKRKHNDSSRVFVLLGDGECDEGSIWESAASASHYELNNLVAIIDMNAIQYDGYTNQILNMDPMSAKWRSFGWDVIEIDGHDIESIINSYQGIRERPLAILAHTIKGKGISFMEGNWKYHNSALTKAEYNQAMEELEGLK